MCNGKVVPITCGFYNCSYQFKGIKFDEARNKVKVRGDKKLNEGNDFDYFNPKTGGTASWQKLKIFTWPMDSDTSENESIDVCYICKKEIKGGKYDSKCEHGCHKNCHDELLRSGVTTDDDDCKMCKY